MKILIFFLVVIGVGIFFRGPIQEHLAGVFFDQASREEKQFVGTASVVNARVREIQQMLKDLGFHKGAADGKMGKETRNALRKFQRKNNMDVTGKVDSKTLNELRKRTMMRPVDSKPSVNKKDGALGRKISYDIKKIQSLLKDAGFYKGAIDGKMGPETVKAIKQFQKSRSLKESGVMNIKTWEALRELEGGR